VIWFSEAVDGFRKQSVNTEALCEVDTLVKAMGYSEIRLFIDFQ